MNQRLNISIFGFIREEHTDLPENERKELYRLLMTEKYEQIMEEYVFGRFAIIILQFKEKKVQYLIENINLNIDYIYCI